MVPRKGGNHQTAVNDGNSGPTGRPFKTTIALSLEALENTSPLKR